MTFKTNEIQATTGNAVTFKSRLFVDIGDVSFELTPNRINQINTEIAAQQASLDAEAVRQAKIAAVAASEGSGDLLFYDTYADLVAALPLPELQVVEVFFDETHNGERARYRIESGVPVYKFNPGTGNGGVTGPITLEDFDPSLNFTGPLGGLAFANEVLDSQINIPVIERTTSFTAASRTKYIVIPTSIGFSITLPLNPSIADRVHFVLYPGPQTNWPINRNGSLIMGLADNIIVDQQYGSIGFVYTGPARGWVLTNA